MNAPTMDAVIVKEENAALVKAAPMPVASPMDMEPAVFSAGLERRKTNRKTLIDWVRGALVDKVDFGSIPSKRGPSKPSLWKPGAEKICGMLNVTPTFPNLIEYEQAALAGKKIESIILRCELLSASGTVVGSGCGARSVAQDYGDLNKALKMCMKSAHIDATLRMGGLSEVFTQDLEDMKEVKDPAPAAPAPAPPAPKPPNDEVAFLKACKKTLVAEADASPLAWAWWKYAVDLGWCLSHEPLADIVENNFVNPLGIDLAGTRGENKKAAAAAFAKHKAAVEAMADALDLADAATAKEAYANLSGTGAEPRGEAAPAPGGAKQRPAPVSSAKAGCPHCKGTAIGASKEYEKVWACQKCGWQWDENGVYWEPHDYMKVMCVMPFPKGTPRSEYLKNPCTLGQVMRLDSKWSYGIVMNYKAQPREYKGKVYQPSKEDLAFDKACAEARAHMEQDKRPAEANNADNADNEEDDVPF